MISIQDQVFENRVPTENLQAAHNRPFADQPIEIEGAERPRVVEGVYQGRLIGHITSQYRSSYKVEFRFLITIPGSPHRNEAELGYFFEVKKLVGPIGPDGAFISKGPRSKLAKFLAQCQEVLGVTHPLTINDLKMMKWELTVDTVRVDWDGNEIPELSRYSVIRTVKPIGPEELEDW